MKWYNSMMECLMSNVLFVVKRTLITDLFSYKEDNIGILPFGATIVTVARC